MNDKNRRRFYIALAIIYFSVLVIGFLVPGAGMFVTLWVLLGWASLFTAAI